MHTDRPKHTRRVHGMAPPFHPLQVATWVIYPLLLVQHFLLLMPLLGSLLFQVIAACVFGISAVVAAVAGGLTATTDPADDACLGGDNHGAGDTVLCYICEAYVESTSKHCRTCGKCVKHFDHHCKWLNTCVGEKNYRYFLILMGGVAGMTTLSLGLSIYLLVLGFMDRGVVEDRIKDAVFLDGILSYWVVASLLIVSIAVLLPLVLLLYQLIGFHGMLINRGMTTYDYIVSEQKRLREKKREKAVGAAAAAAASKGIASSTNNENSQTQSNIPSKSIEMSQSYEQVNVGSKKTSIGTEVEGNLQKDTPDTYTQVPQVSNEKEVKEHDSIDDLENGGGSSSSELAVNNNDHEEGEPI